MCTYVKRRPLLDRNAKVQWRDDVVAALDKSKAVFLANYAGMTVEELTSFRRELKAVKADFHVVKNTVAKKSIEGRNESALADYFKTQTGVVFAYGDAAAAAKSVAEAEKKYEKLQVSVGFMEKSIIDQAGIKTLASLPSREVLLAQIVGMLVKPHRDLLGVLNGVSRNLVQVVSAIKDQKTA